MNPDGAGDRRDGTQSTSTQFASTYDLIVDQESAWFVEAGVQLGGGLWLRRGGLWLRHFECSKLHDRLICVKRIRDLLIHVEEEREKEEVYTVD